jgi:hypothetical protein
VVVCDPFLPNTCSGGLICQASSAGVQLVCKDDAGIVPVEVGGVCVPAKRELVSARFSADGKQITISLNAAARTAAFSCSSLFDGTNGTALGPRAWCSTTDRSLTIQLDRSATLQPGQSLAVRTDQLALVDKLQSGVFFKGQVEVATCTECTPPVATITGPQVRCWLYKEQSPFRLMLKVLLRTVCLVCKVWVTVAVLLSGALGQLVAM